MIKRKFRTIDSNLLHFMKSCCYVYGFPNQDSDILIRRTYCLLQEDMSFRKLLTSKWPDNFFVEFMTAVIEDDIFYSSMVSRDKINKFFQLTKKNGLDYSMSRLKYSLKTGQDVSDVKIEYSNSNPNPKRKNYFIGTSIPKNGAPAPELVSSCEGSLEEALAELAEARKLINKKIKDEKE